jgi:hypothetical protein
MKSISKEINSLIELKIKEFISSSSPEAEYLKYYVAKHLLLPMYIDWTCFYGIRPNGEIVVISHEDEEGEPFVERDPRIINLVLFQGAKKYSDLTRLVPERPQNAIECQYCEGEGEIEYQGVEIVCYCGGLGWIPPQSELERLQ